MRLSEQILRYIMFQSVFCGVLFCAILLEAPSILIFAIGAAGEFLLLSFCAGRIYRSIRHIDDVVQELNETEHPSEELLHEKVIEEPFLSRMETLVQKYAAERTRQSAAQIFDKQTELTALQSQINPHFLYNTLETIRGQALLDDHPEIARMTEALGAFFRYSISKKGMLVTLRDELANINNYMLIQRYRFNNRFSLEIILDEEDEIAYDFLIPRLIIQPVVENAIFHGLEDLDEGGKVIIEVIVTEKNLFLMVSDNGKGIPEQELQELNERIHSSGQYLQEPQGGTHRTGIALPNIHKRLQLLFGEEYGVNVYSTVDQGTDVEIVIPANYERKEGP